VDLVGKVEVPAFALLIDEPVAVERDTSRIASRASSCSSRAVRLAMISDVPSGGVVTVSP